MDLSFLSNVDVKEVAVKARASRVTLDKTPIEGAHFRVYKNGRIFASPACAEEYKLEFSPKGDDDTTTGCGLDIFKSEDWPMINIEQNMLFIGIVPREGNAKIDVYGSTSYNEDGSPKRSIMSNTISAYGKDVLVPALELIYGVNFEEVDYVDLVMQTEYPIVAPKGVYHIPKTVSRGVNKGDTILLNRKEIFVCPLTVWEAPKAGEQVDLEDSIKEVTNEEEGAQTSAEENLGENFQKPSVDNNFSTNTPETSGAEA